jgi:hypothetical protein
MEKPTYLKMLRIILYVNAELLGFPYWSGKMGQKQLNVTPAADVVSSDTHTGASHGIYLHIERCKKKGTQ